MRVILKGFFLLCLCMPFLPSNAQISSVAAGNSTKTEKGSISYSIGLVNYIQITNQNASISQGPQQPFEIYLLKNANPKENISVFPNPTNDVSFIVEKKYNGESLMYILVDMTGKILERNSSISNKTTISLQTYPAGIYYIQIRKKQRELGVFKIVKL